MTSGPPVGRWNNSNGLWIFRRPRDNSGQHQSTTNPERRVTMIGNSNCLARGKMRTSSRCSYGEQSNNYLKWAFIEAANVVVRHRNHPKWRDKHVSRLYERIRRRKGHSVAVGAVARHLSEAAFWVLKKNEPYKEPKTRTVSPAPAAHRRCGAGVPRQGRARA